MIETYFALKTGVLLGAISVKVLALTACAVKQLADVIISARKKKRKHR